VKTALILVGISSCLSTLAGGVLALLSILGFIDSIPPRSAIGFAWWSLSLSVIALVLAHVLIVLGVRRQSIGSVRSVALALGFYTLVMAIAPIVIILMVLRLLVFYS